MPDPLPESDGGKWATVLAAVAVIGKAVHWVHQLTTLRDPQARKDIADARAAIGALADQIADAREKTVLLQNEKDVLAKLCVVQQVQLDGQAAEIAVLTAKNATLTEELVRQAKEQTDIRHDMKGKINSLTLERDALLLGVPPAQLAPRP